MQPVDSDYIYFIESQTTIATNPWCQKVHKWDADKKVEVWRKAWLITGSDLRSLGMEISDEHYDRFFNIGCDSTLQEFVIARGNPEGNLVFEAYISSQS